jgi:purine-binding chemotaxis protein CheW
LSVGAKQFLTFFSGDEQFAAPLSDISEIFRRSRITRVPNAPPSLLGIVGLRGAPTPVISLARLLGKDDKATSSSRLLLLAGSQSLGLCVDRVGALTELPIEDIERTGVRHGFGRVYQFEGAALRVLELGELLRREFAGASAAPARVQTVPTPSAQGANPAGDLVALLGFELAGQAYALPLAEVSEVLPLPPQLAVIAQSDDAMLGVTRNHDRLLPVVSTRRLLGLPAEPNPSNHLVVTLVGDAVIGLAVDRLRSIVRVPPEAIDKAPSLLNKGAGEAQVQSICRLPGSGGLVGILSGERLFHDEKVAHILADGRGEQMERAEEQTNGEQFLIFRLGEEEYGLPLSSVDEVARLPDRLTRVPKTPAFVAGVLNLRGRVTPIIDQRLRFASGKSGRAERPRIVVTKSEGWHAGFIVDSVTEILSLSAKQIDVTPELTADARRLFSRIATLGDGQRLILLIEPREMLDRAERDLLAELDASTSGAA